MDTSQQKLLEVTYKAFENAGKTWDSVAGTRTSVFVGNFSFDHWMIQSRDWHSSRKIATSCASGRLTAAEAIIIAYLRGKAVLQDSRKGVMLAVRLGSEQTLPYVAGKEIRVTMAAYNSPGSATLSRDADAMKQVSHAPTWDGIFNPALSTGGNAYHSHHMQPLGSTYELNKSEGLSHVRKHYSNATSLRYP